MRILIMAAIAAALAAHDPATNAGRALAAGPETNAAYDAAEGQKFRMASLIGIGDIVIGEEVLTTSDGQQLPIRKLGEGLYAFTDPPSKLTNGEDFCFSQPVNGFTWHRHQEGLWVMNAGAWAEAPAVPAPDVWQAEGGCALFTYKPDGE
jgi:hypothetical protein